MKKGTHSKVLRSIGQDYIIVENIKNMPINLGKRVLGLRILNFTKGVWEG